MISDIRNTEIVFQGKPIVIFNFNLLAGYYVSNALKYEGISGVTKGRSVTPMHVKYACTPLTVVNRHKFTNA